MRAPAALAAASGMPARLLSPSLLKSWQRNDVWRCGVESSGGALPTSVIVKRFKGEPERGFDEWAALAFLTAQMIEPPVAPRFLAGDAVARVFVMDDLGSGRSAVSAAVERPGPFVTFTHGDMAPSNTHITPTALWLLDFEYAGVRHALYDALFWTLVCPFPASLIERADAAYRAELARGCPPATTTPTPLRGR